jgi:hypothetical protein
MTRDEHIARAMLLGCRYDADTRSYYAPSPGPIYDCDTMLPLSDEAWLDRYTLVMDGRPNYNDT